MLPKDVHTRIFDIINVTAVTSLLDGGIVRGKPNLSEIKKWVSILSSSMNNDSIQENILSINCYVPNYGNGRKDSVSLDAISGAVKTALDNYAQTEDKYFQFRFGNFIEFPDQENGKYTTFTFRLECYIGNDTK